MTRFLVPMLVAPFLLVVTIGCNETPRPAPPPKEGSPKDVPSGVTPPKNAPPKDQKDS